VTRSVVTLEVVFFCSRYRLFAKQTNVFIVELDKKKYPSSMFFYSAMMKKLK